MSTVELSPRVDDLLGRLDAWATLSPARALAIRVGVTLVGPLVILTGVAMLVLPGPGLVVMAAGLALLALEYAWARRALGLLGHSLSRARQAALPRDASPGRRALGGLMVAGVLVAGFLATTAVTTLVGTLTLR